MKTGLKVLAIVLAWVIGTAFSLFELALLVATFRAHGFWLGGIAWMQLQMQMLLYAAGAIIVIMALFSLARWSILKAIAKAKP